MFKKQRQENNALALPQNFQEDIEQAPVPDLPMNQYPQYPQQYQQQQPIQQQIQPRKNSTIYKTEITDKGTILFTGEANYQVNVGDCQIVQ